MGDGSRSPEVVSVDAEVVGAVKSVLWEDTSGFDVVTVSVSGADVVVPIRHDEVEAVTHGVSETLSVTYAAQAVERAPSLQDLGASGGWSSGLEMLNRHYDVALAGPPPGPPTGTLPPWFGSPSEGAEGGTDQVTGGP